MARQISNSPKVNSNQQGIHENLELIVRKHFETEYKKPIAEHTQLTFNQIRKMVETELKNDTPLLFDSFCGTGLSTSILAKRYPQALVIGIDRSLPRLSKTYNEVLPENAMLVQAECADFWLLAKQSGWQLARHSIYYPNPYPKAKHLKRRWHAHPAYPLLFKLGGEIELRTNWKIYADEFKQAFIYATDYLKDTKLVCKGVETLCLDGIDYENKNTTHESKNTTHESKNTACQSKNSTEFMTLFEKKYALNGQLLYECKYSDAGKYDDAGKYEV